MPDIGIADKLQKQLTEAQSEHVYAFARFKEVMRAVPTGYPTPDASLILRQVANESRSALRRCVYAMERCTDFWVHGTVPDDLRAAFHPDEVQPIENASNQLSFAGKK